MKTSLLALALLCISAPALHAQLDDTDPQYRSLCREALSKPFTAPPADPAIKPNCDSTRFYFGIGQPVDYKAAVACAYAEYAHPNTTLSPFPGAGILSMIYANGHGTKPNLDLATRFTCENFASPSEIEARLDILSADRETHSLQPFDLCATASSANTDDWCTSIEARQSEVERNLSIGAFRATLPQPALLPFEALQLAEQDFEDARIHNELDLTGATPTFAGFHTAEKNFATAHAFDPTSAPAPLASPSTLPASAPMTFAPIRLASQLEEQNDLGDRFLSDLKLFTAPNFIGPTDLNKANKNLEATLKLVRAAAPRRLKTTTITGKGIDDTQRLWLHLRDSWLAFIAAAKPSPLLPEETATYLTLERSRQLNDLINTAREH